MKLGFRAHSGVSTIVAGNIPVLWGSNAWNSSVAITAGAAVNSQTVIDIMASEKLYPAESEYGVSAYISLDIPSWATQITLSVFSLETDGAGSIVLELSDNTGAYGGASYVGTTTAVGSNVSWATLSKAILTSGITESSYKFAGTIRLTRSHTADAWVLRSRLSGVGTSLAYTGLAVGRITAASAPTKLRLALSAAADNFINGTVSVVYR